MTLMLPEGNDKIAKIFSQHLAMMLLYYILSLLQLVITSATKANEQLVATDKPIFGIEKKDCCRSFFKAGNK